MRLIFFTHPEFFGSQSMPRYARWLAKGMKARGYIVQVWRPKAFFYKIPAPATLKKWLGYIDQYCIFPFWVKKHLRHQEKNTIYVFTDHALGPWVPLVNMLPHVIHCHDFLAQRSALGEIKENPTSVSGQIYQKFIRSGFSKGKNFISISNKTQADLHQFLPQKPQYSEIVYNGLNQEFKPVGEIKKIRKDLSEAFGISLNEGFILHVGGNQWYKNRLGVVAIYNAWRKVSEKKLPLIMVGKEPIKKLESFKNSTAYGSDIHFLKEVSDELVRKLYGTASVFIFPSLAEGFGWPIAEAMASGCPVITTNEAPMTEVGGDAAYYISHMPAEYVDGWANKECVVLEQVLNLSNFEREERVKLGLENSARFDSEKALNKIEAIYKDIFAAY